MHSSLFVLLRSLGDDPDQVEEVLRLVPKQGLQVADEPVHVPLARRLVDDVLVVVVAQATAQFLVVHLRLVFPSSPSSSNLKDWRSVSIASSVSETFLLFYIFLISLPYLIRVGHLVLPAIAGPGDEVLAVLVAEQLKDELPQLDRPCGGDGRGVRGSVRGVGGGGQVGLGRGRWTKHWSLRNS